MSYQSLYEQMDAPYTEFPPSILGPEFQQELQTVSSLWFACGYRPGVTAYLNFFLLKDFIVKHDTSYPPRFQSFKSMADSFYQTDLFIRDVTDSGLKPTGGISNPKVQNLLRQIMARHKAVTIPQWMMTYFGWSLFENVETQAGVLSEEHKRLHLQYMSKTYRLMGMAFSDNRSLMEQFARSVEDVHAGASENLERHAKNILVIGVLAGVPTSYESISKFLPEKTRAVFEPIYPRVKPSLFWRLAGPILGKILMKQAIGSPREAVPFTN